MSGILMSNSYSCRLSMGRENWPATETTAGYRKALFTLPDRDKSEKKGSCFSSRAAIGCVKGEAQTKTATF